jgi:hypothetical protein
VVDAALRARGGTRLRAREEWLSRRESGCRPSAPPSRDTRGRFVAGGEAAAVS